MTKFTKTQNEMTLFYIKTIEQWYLKWNLSSDCQIKCNTISRKMQMQFLLGIWTIEKVILYVEQRDMNRFFFIFFFKGELNDYFSTMKLICNCCEEASRCKAKWHCRCACTFIYRMMKLRSADILGNGMEWQNALNARHIITGIFLISLCWRFDDRWTNRFEVMVHEMCTQSIHQGLERGCERREPCDTFQITIAVVHMRIFCRF